MKPLPPPAPWRMLLTLPTLLRKGGALPAGTARWQSGPLDPNAWKHFAERLGYPAQLEPPLCFHYLALQRAQLQQMLAPDFPHPLPGMVHLAQGLTRLQPWRPDEAWQLDLRLAEEAGAGGALLLRLHSDFRQQGQPVLHAESLYLARRGERGARPKGRPPLLGERIAAWPLPAHAGRDYARLSGDFNPIHLWGWSARLLGQRQPIIHGMHSAARCEAELSRHLGRPLEHLQIEFQRPLGLPNTATLHRVDDEGFALLDGEGKRVAAGSFC